MTDTTLRPTPSGMRRDELVRKQYTFVKLSTCKACGRDVEVWTTYPGRKSILFDPAMAVNDYMYCHFGTCTKRNHKALKPSDASADIQQALFSLGARHRAKAVIMLFDDTAFEAVWHDSADGEDVRSHLIAVGNHIRQQIRECA